MLMDCMLMACLSCFPFVQFSYGVSNSSSFFLPSRSCIKCYPPKWLSGRVMAARPALSFLLAVLACTGPAQPSPPLLLRPRERERDSGGASGGVNIAVVHSGSSHLPETSAGVGGVGSASPAGSGSGAGPSSSSNSGTGFLSRAWSGQVGESVMTPWGPANVIWLAVNESSPGSLLLQLCELLATTPLQGLVFEEEKPPPPNRAPLAPMLEFVSAQTGVPVIAVGGGAGLGREPQVRVKIRSCWLKFRDGTFTVS